MTRIVISERHGGFGLSPQAIDMLKALGYDEYDRDIPRDDARLLKVVDEIGAEAASGSHANLAVVEIPDDVKWHVVEYDGWEQVHEDHRAWQSSGEATCS